MLKPTNLDEEIIFSLFKIMRMVRQRSSCVSEAHEPSILQIQALHLISCGKSTMKEVADELYIESPTATVLIDKLVKLKFVKRVHGTKDRRQVRLSLTTYGQKISTKCLQQKMQRMKYLISRLSPKDKQSLQKILLNLQKGLNSEEK